MTHFNIKFGITKKPITFLFKANMPWILNDKPSILKNFNLLYQDGDHLQG